MTSILVGLGFAAAFAVPVMAALADVGYADLPGFANDDQRPALRLFLASCGAPTALRPALPKPTALDAVCAKAKALPPDLDVATARAFFEQSFVPRRVGAPDAAFFTGYYEPVVAGSPTRTSAFATPLYAPPPDLVGGGPFPGLDPALTAARRRADGGLEPMPDRAAIEDGALRQTPLVYLRDPIEAFFIQVQGSARIRLPDGSLRRLVYAGRNGHPYTSIGKVLVDRLHIPPAEMGMAKLRDWIHANGEGPAGHGGELMRANRSYIFFRFDDALPADAGPTGGEGIGLTPLRSLAIDRKSWPYGLPFYADATMPWQSATPTPFRRLLIGQDTGSAIIGPARGDIFFGTGEDAARRAGDIRAKGTLFVLWPRAPAAAAPR